MKHGIVKRGVTTVDDVASFCIQYNIMINKLSHEFSLRREITLPFDAWLGAIISQGTVLYLATCTGMLAMG